MSRFLRLNLPKRRRSLLLLFLVGIFLPSLILSILSFRSIHNEVLLAERTYERDADAFQQVLQEDLIKEIRQVFNEVRRRSNWLFDQPRTLEDLGRAQSLDSVVGVDAIFLFRNGKRVYPIYGPKLNQPIESDTWALDGRKQDSLPELRNLRVAFQVGDLQNALHWLIQLERKPNAQTLISGDLRASLQLMRFRILVRAGHQAMALSYSTELIRKFLKKPEQADIEDAFFVFETMLSDALSFEGLPSEQRELFWNLRHNLLSQMNTALVWDTHREMLEELSATQYSEEDGLTFSFKEDSWGFRMAHPWLPGEQTVLGVLSPESFQQRLVSRLMTTQREWRQVYFRLVDHRDSVLLERLPQDSLVVLRSTLMQVPDPNWTLTIFQRDLREIRKDSRGKMILLYSLVGFSLIVLILGSLFVTNGIAQERDLLAMKSNFLSSISHELKTPLTSIRMFSEMMAQGRVQKAEKIKEYSTLIGKEAERLDSLIQAILGYTRLERGQASFHWERLDFASVVERVIESLEPIAIQKGLDLDWNLGRDAYVHGDHTALYSLVQNLIDNAIKYTPSLGSIQVILHASDDEVSLSVSDTGVGIPPAEQKNIFTDFYRVGDELTRSTKGSGLGLAIVRRVVETHKAHIQVQSRLGKGSTFTVRFKRATHEQQDSNRRR